MIFLILYTGLFCFFLYLYLSYEQYKKFNFWAGFEQNNTLGLWLSLNKFYTDWTARHRDELRFNENRQKRVPKNTRTSFGLCSIAWLQASDHKKHKSYVFYYKKTLDHKKHIIIN